MTTAATHEYHPAPPHSPVTHMVDGAGDTSGLGIAAAELLEVCPLGAEPLNVTAVLGQTRVVVQIDALGERLGRELEGEIGAGLCELLGDLGARGRELEHETDNGLGVSASECRLLTFLIFKYTCVPVPTMPYAYTWRYRPRSALATSRRRNSEASWPTRWSTSFVRSLGVGTARVDQAAMVEI